MQKVWNAVNGKKRMIALGIFGLEVVFRAAGHSPWADQLSWLSQLANFGQDQIPGGVSLADLAGFITGAIGVGHAIVKADWK